ncbi:MAG: S-layer homology domain-containing protein [Lachnospirales bacterium]
MKVRRFLLVLIVAFSFSFPYKIYADSFIDIEDSYAKEEIQNFNMQGYFDVFNFKNSAEFLPEKYATRGEAIVLVVTSNNLNLTYENNTPFIDFEEILDVYKPYVITSYNEGVVNGVSTKNGVEFAFDDLITREQLVTLLGNYYNVSSNTENKFLDNDSVSDWALPYVNYFNKNGLVIGDDKGNFNPKDYVTRQEVVIIIDRCEEFFNGYGNNVSVYVGSGEIGYLNSAYEDSSLTIIADIDFDDDNNIVFADSLINKIRIAKDGVVSDVFGNLNETDFAGTPIGGYVDGDLSEVLLSEPQKIITLDNGMILFTESTNNTIRAYDENRVYTLGGKIESGYKNGKLSEALFNRPMGMAEDSKGNIYVADTLNHVIRKIDVNGNVTLYAGTPEKSGNVNSTLTNSLLNEPVDIFIDEYDTLYIADSGNNAIKKIENGNIVLVAGGSTEIDPLTDTEIGGDLDGEATKALFNYPMGIFVEDKKIYIADTFNNKVKVVENGYVTTLAGNGENGNMVGDLTEASFSSPTAVLVLDNIIYVADSNNHMIKNIGWEDDVQ